MPGSRIRQVEEYARRTMTGAVAHDFKHVDRVRRWARLLAAGESFQDPELLEAAALLHDIGLSATTDGTRHAEVGAAAAADFLHGTGSFAEAEIRAITEAVRYHSSIADRNDRLLDILRDADSLDALGAVGLMRAFTSKAGKPDYDPANVKSDTWGLSGRGFDARFDDGKGIGNTILDQVNYQISYYDNLRTETARRLAAPLVAYTKRFVLQLEREIAQG